ncbi:ASKHA domain-containing protein [Bacteroidales bacterium]|nr:ASKHA domain-containing protein [Bacteroidales bacterium]
MKKVTISLQPLGKTIEVNQGVKLIDVLHEYGVEFPCAGKGTCGKCKIKLLNGNIAISETHRKALNTLDLDKDWRLACYSHCDEDVTFEIGQYKNIILADETEFDIESQDGFGIAVDLGTTTMVAQLLNLSNGEILGVDKAMNPQKKFGADLISRIQKGMEGHELELTTMIRQKVEEMIYGLVKKAKVNLNKVVIVGNTVMHHSFCGHELSPLAMYPFSTPHLEGESLSTTDLGWQLKIKEPIEFYPSIGAYVGSDILAGIISTKLYNNEKYTVLVDLGTNGEITVGNKDKIVCASTAAGPAFEGANISMGMQATTGAISTIEESDNGWKFHVIGNEKARGICGSGLIDAVALLQKEEKIGIFGDLASGEDTVPMQDEVTLAQQDIREFQLAKAAIAAGIEILIKELKITNDDIHSVYIAGGFGSYINLDHVIATGMLEFPKEKIHKMGNTALIGAKMLLFQNMDFVKPILEKTNHISLESAAEFQDIYVEKMMFVNA